MKKKIILALMCAIFVVACNQNGSERQKAAGEKLTGSVQETAGNITGNKDLESEGNKNKLKGDLRSTKEDIKDTISN